MLERAPDPGPVGAGLLLQPTAMAVLERLRWHDGTLAFGARALNAVFQSDFDAMAWPRDRLMPLAAVPWARKRMLATLSGRAVGPFGNLRT